MDRSAGINGVLLLNRLLLAACFLPAAFGRAMNVSGFAATLTMKGMPYGDVVATIVVTAEIFGPLALTGLAGLPFHQACQLQAPGPVTA